MTDKIEETNNDTLEQYHFFSCPIYKIDKKDFLDIVSTVASESLTETIEENFYN